MSGKNSKKSDNNSNPTITAGTMTASAINVTTEVSEMNAKFAAFKQARDREIAQKAQWRQMYPDMPDEEFESLVADYRAAEVKEQVVGNKRNREDEDEEKELKKDKMAYLEHIKIGHTINPMDKPQRFVLPHTWEEKQYPHHAVDILRKIANRVNADTNFGRRVGYGSSPAERAVVELVKDIDNYCNLSGCMKIKFRYDFDHEEMVRNVVTVSKRILIFLARCQFPNTAVETITDIADACFEEGLLTHKRSHTNHEGYLETYEDICKQLRTVPQEVEKKAVPPKNQYPVMKNTSAPPTGKPKYWGGGKKQQGEWKNSNRSVPAEKPLFSAPHEPHVVQYPYPNQQAPSTYAQAFPPPQFNNMPKTLPAPQGSFQHQYAQHRTF